MKGGWRWLKASWRIPLSQWLSQQPQLQRLSLLKTGIGPKGLTHLLPALKQHPSLVQLDLGLNPKNEELQVELERILERNQKANLPETTHGSRRDLHIKSVYR